MGDYPTAIVLAGVHDWGACVLNRAVVRPLAPIANRPIVDHVLSWLARAGVRRAVVCTNGHASEMRRVIGQGASRQIEIEYRDETMPRGPAGCVRDALGESPEGDCIVAEACLASQFSLSDMLRAHQESGAAMTMAGYRAGDGDEDVYSPVGVYVVSPSVAEHIPDRGFSDLKEHLIPKLYGSGLRIDLHRIDGVAHRLDGIGTYFSVNEWAIGQATMGAWDLDGYSLSGQAMIHVDAVVSESARLIGPVLVGSSSVIGDDVIVVGPASIASDCVVGDRAVVSRSAMWSGSVLSEDAHIDRCLLADHARVAVGSRQRSAVCVARPDEAVGHSNDQPIAAGAGSFGVGVDSSAVSIGG
jgi:NDP-sugar pyrophosphorylase family protein